jgi:hypothetical protein
MTGLATLDKYGAHMFFKKCVINLLGSGYAKAARL